jgi:hypothetical protein
MKAAWTAQTAENGFLNLFSEGKRPGVQVRRVYLAIKEEQSGGAGDLHPGPGAGSDSLRSARANTLGCAALTASLHGGQPEKVPGDQ